MPKTQNKNGEKKLAEVKGNCGANAHLHIVPVGQVPQLFFPAKNETELSHVGTFEGLDIHAETAGGWNVKSIIGSYTSIVRKNPTLKPVFFDVADAFEAWEAAQLAKSAPTADLSGHITAELSEDGNTIILKLNRAALSEQVRITLNTDMVNGAFEVMMKKSDVDFGNHKNTTDENAKAEPLPVAAD